MARGVPSWWRRVRWALAVPLAALLILVGGVAAASAAPVWPTPSGVSLPAGANTNPQSSLSGVTCANAGNCVAVGYYEDSSGTNQPLAVGETNGVWGQGVEITVPANHATTGNESAAFFAAACTSPGNCVAVGSYNDNHGADDTQALAATETNGVWAQAQELALPTGYATGAGAQSATLNSVACSSAGSCTAVGQYNDSSGDGQAMTVTETNGVWAQAHELALPAGYNSGGGGAQEAALYTVACTAAANCVAGGYYTDSNGNGDDQAMVATETGGTWTQASEVALPGGADTAAGAQDASIDALSCTSTGNCVAGGSYTDANGNGDLQAMDLTETGGLWSRASELALPAGATTVAGEQYAEIDALSCTSAGNCIAGGFYADTDGNDEYQAMTAVETSGVWAQANAFALPSGALTTASGRFSDVYSLACTSPGVCVGAGFYTGDSGGSQAMVASSVPTLALSSTSVPAAVTGVPYSATLAASGGKGSYTWSVSSGTLPAGLSLNPATGMIAGTPLAIGSASVTVTATDPGPPSQSASEALTITVAGPSIASFTHDGATLSVSVACGATATQTCGGTLTLTTTEHHTGHTLTAVSASKRAKKPKRTTATVTVGSADITVTGGTTKVITVTLNQTGKQLLAKFHKLPAQLTLSFSGSVTPVATETLTLTPSKPKHRRKK